MPFNAAWRGRGSRGYRSGRGTRESNHVPRAPSPPIGALLQTLSTSTIQEDCQDSEFTKKVGITDCEYITSYNWLDHRDPKIIIPGCPPLWSPPANDPKLKEDGGSYYRDPNAAHFPPHPLEPAVRAVLVEDSLTPQDVDIFACSSTLGSLLRFVRQIDKPFRFFVEAVGHTVFFTRHESSPTETIPNVRGYGHTFPEAYTSWNTEVKGSVSHQRLLRYDLGGLQCIVRFECDGYLESKLEIGASTSTKPSEHITGNVSDLLSGLDVGPQIGKGSQDTPLQVDFEGRRIPQASIFDLKTRAAWKANTVLEEELPRFWVAQIPNFILARHEYGVFHDISVTEVSDKVKEWERRSQEELRQLVFVLHKIIGNVKKQGGKKLEVRCKSVGTLELREQHTDEHDVLPCRLKGIWMGGEHAAEEGPETETCLNGPSFAAAADKQKGCTMPTVNNAGTDYTACSADCGYCGRCLH